MQIKYILSIIFLLLAWNASPIVIMLDPAGDAKQTGRTIGDTFERSITLGIARELKEALEKQIPSCSVIITRSAGEAVQPLQNATFANRLAPTLFISIHAYEEIADKPSITIYQLSLGDSFVTKSYDLALIPYDQAHRSSSMQSSTYAAALSNELRSKPYQCLFNTCGAFALPFPALLGIQCPAIGLEIGIAKSDDWRLLINPLSMSIATSIHHE